MDLDSRRMMKSQTQSLVSLASSSRRAVQLGVASHCPVQPHYTSIPCYIRYGDGELWKAHPAQQPGRWTTPFARKMCLSFLMDASHHVNKYRPIPLCPTSPIPDRQQAFDPIDLRCTTRSDETRTSPIDLYSYLTCSQEARNPTQRDRLRAVLYLCVAPQWSQFEGPCKLTCSPHMRA